MTYEERRKRAEEAVDRSAQPLTEIVRALDSGEHKWPYNYVRDVLRGLPGKRSAEVIDQIEATLQIPESDDEMRESDDAAGPPESDDVTIESDEKPESDDDT